MSRCIDADALIRKFKTASPMAIDGRARQMVEEMPTIEPQRTGRWELIDDTEFRVPGYRCSVCHCECEDWDKKPTYRFCPNCGARMEESE